MLSCDVVSDLQLVYASGEASAETRRLVEEHLAQCAKCRAAFGKASPIEKELPPLAAKPANGGRFIVRARRLIFAIIGGLLFVSAVIWAMFEHVVMQDYYGMSLPNLPGFDLLWLAFACIALVIYVALLRRPGKSMWLPAIAIGVAFLFLSLLAFQIIVGAHALGIAAGFAILAIALGATFIMLPRLPNVTLVTILVLLALNGLLFARAVVGVAQTVSMADYTEILPGTLGHPPQGSTLNDAARLDLHALGLEWQKSEPSTWIDNNWVGNGQAVQSVYTGNDRQVLLTLVQLPSTEEADQFFVNWNNSVRHGVQLMHMEINLPGVPGQGHFTRSFGTQASTAYIAWQNEDWVTIIEVPGTFGQAVPLANAVKDAIVRKYNASAK